MLNLGTVAQGSTIRIPFSTASQTGAAVAFSATIEAADFDIYKDGSTTQRSSTAGFTVSETFDSMTGMHMLAIDLSDNTDAGFYAAGSTFHVALTPDETVDSQTVAAWIGAFTIETEAQEAQRLYLESVYPLGCVIATTTGNTTSRILLTDILDAQTADEDLIGWLLWVWDATNGQTVPVVIVSVQSARLFNVVTFGEGAAMDFTVAAGDRVWLQGPAPLRATVPGRTLGVSATGDADADINKINGATITGDGSGTPFDVA